MARNKKCPQCAELIKADAQVCRYCSFRFPEPAKKARKYGKPCTSCGVLNAYGAKSCSSCNALLPQPTAAEKRAGCIGVIVVLVIVSAIIGALFSMKPQTSSGSKPIEVSSSAPKDPNIRRQDAISGLGALGEMQIRAMLKDSESAVFEDTEGRISHGERVACGAVNSKNSFGAMAGFTGWVVRFDRDKAYLENQFDDSGFMPIWNKYCTGRQDIVDEDTSPMHVASREIKNAGHSCGRVTGASYDSDGSIHAICSNRETYRVMDLGQKFVAMKCSAAQKLGVKDC